MSALGPQKQLGTPPIGGRKMAVMFQLAFEESPSAEKLLLVCHSPPPWLLLSEKSDSELVDLSLSNFFLAFVGLLPSGSETGHLFEAEKLRDFRDPSTSRLLPFLACGQGLFATV